MVTKREYWLDVIKIIASFLVIILHTVCYGINDKISSPALLAYYMGTFAIPLFWMASGYIQLRKKLHINMLLRKYRKFYLLLLYGTQYLFYLDF